MKHNESRRGFLKKAAYTAPAMMALGALAPTALSAKASSAVLGLRSEIKVEKTEIQSLRVSITDLQSQLNTPGLTKSQKAAIKAQIAEYKLQIANDRVDILGLKDQIQVIKG